MATIPVPPSYSEILANAIDSTVSKLGLPALRKGNPVLSILEAASRSDARQAQDIFNFLNAVSLDRATGQALDRIGADEDRARIPETPSTGPVTITDTSFEKISTRLFQGKPAPNVGSLVVYVQDASDFPASGSVYIGRGTTNLEGPIAYTSLTNNTTYWTLNLSLVTPTQKYHNLGESVILAQGGNRLIPNGTSVQTSQGNASSSIKYTTIFAAVIPDGETTIANVQVACTVAGVTGNTIAGGISSFTSVPFPGATVTNPLPFTNGLATEDDETYREALRLVRQSRARGTALAIKVNLTGVIALDENRRILSTSVLTRQGYPTTVYVDDGSGYEMKDAGIPYEIIVDQGLGGEQYMQLTQGRPVAKAYARTVLTAPFTLTEGSSLFVEVGGVLYEHTFTGTSFRNIENASAYEVSSSINANSTLGYQARLSDNGNTVTIFAKSDTNEDIEVVAAPAGFDDANDVLGFPLGRNSTLRLYKNDRLLTKDGSFAIITGNPQSTWSSLTSGDDIIVKVDGIQLAAITITDQDFIDHTQYGSVATSNSLESWATVLNAKIPGITTSVVGPSLRMTSNLGRSSRAAISLDASCDFVIKGVFNADSVVGENLDYTLDRNLGQIRIEDHLIGAEGDSFTASSLQTRAFIETPEFNTLVFSNNPAVSVGALTSVPNEYGAELWFAVDGQAQVIKTGLDNTAIVTVNTFGSPIYKVTYKANNTVNLFANVRPGDFVIITHDNAEGPTDGQHRGMWRVAEVGTVMGSPNYSYFVTEQSGYWEGAPIGPPPILNTTFPKTGITFVRSNSVPQRVFFDYANGTIYTPAALATLMNQQLQGATASVRRSKQIRVRTNRWNTEGDIAFVAGNLDGNLLGFQLGLLETNRTSHIAAVEAQAESFVDEGGTPEFVPLSAFPTSTYESYPNTFFNITAQMPTEFGIRGGGAYVQPDHIITSARPLSPDSDPRQGNKGNQTTIEYLPAYTPFHGWSVPTATVAVGDRFVGQKSGAIMSIVSLQSQQQGDVSLETFNANFQQDTVDRLTPTPTVGIFNTHSVDSRAAVRRAPFNRDWPYGQRLFVQRPFDLGSGDFLGVKLDGDDASKRFLAPMFRNVSTVGTTYGTTNILRDEDNNDLSLAKTFKTTFNWEDYAVHMHARGKSHRIAGVDTNKSILWRYYRMGPEGEQAYVTYEYPSLPSQPVKAVVNNNNDEYTTVNVKLASGPARTGYTYRNSSYIAVCVPAAAVNGLYQKWYALNLKITNASRTGSTVTLQIGGPPGTQGHGLLVGNLIWVQSSDPNFPSGVKTITALGFSPGPSADQVMYTEAGAAVSVANIGTVSRDTDGEAKWGGGNIAVNDIFKASSDRFEANGSLLGNGGVQYEDPMRITTLDPSWIGGATPGGGPSAPLVVFQSFSWIRLNNTSEISIFPLNTGANTITAIASTVSAQVDSPLTGVAIGDGAGDTSGLISRATYEAAPDGLANAFPTNYQGVSRGYPLYDGINWIRSHNTPVNEGTDFTFVFKRQVESSITTNSDWANEKVRLVPITAKNINGWLNSPGPGGLFANADIQLALSGHKPQIATLTIGASGSVEVQGGAANGVIAAVAGPARIVSNPYYGAFGLNGKTFGLNVAASESTGLNARHWVRIQNTLPVSKARITAATALTSITNPTPTTSKFTLSGTAAIEIAGLAKSTVFQVERQGKFVNFRHLSGTNILPLEGQMVHISAVASSPPTPATVNIRNQGFFRCVRSDNLDDPNQQHAEFWIENDNAVEEVAVMHIAVLSYDSVIPGDKIVINSGIWGATNSGEYEITAIDLETLTGVASNTQTFTVGAKLTPQGAIPALGANAGLIAIKEGTPSRVYKKIRSIEPNEVNPNLSFIKFEISRQGRHSLAYNAGATKISENAGSYVQAIDKLDFPVDIVTGVDGYRYHTGLIAEANKVAYGQENDAQQYPGVVAAGARVNIEGPVVHRVQIGLAIRVRTGVSLNEIQNQVRSAVAAVINGTNVGVSIAISDLIDAAASVNGVLSVAVVSPTFSPGTDLISIQPFEKPLVLSLDEDILVSFIGE